MAPRPKKFVLASFYFAVLLLSFFLYIFNPSFTLTGLLLLPLATSVCVGFIAPDIKEAVTIVIVGCFLVVFAILFSINIPSVSDAFWSFLNARVPAETEEQALGWILVMAPSYLTIHLPLGVFGSCVGRFIRNELQPYLVRFKWVKKVGMRLILQELQERSGEASLREFMDSIAINHGISHDAQKRYFKEFEDYGLIEITKGKIRLKKKEGEGPISH